MKAKLFVPLGIFVVLAIFLGIGLTLKPREVPSPFIGKPAPSFSLPQLHQPQAMMSPADMQGQVWVLNVWASWCGPCRDEHPILVNAAKAKVVPIIGLNYKDDPRNAQEWLRKLGDPYIVTASDLNGRVGIDYGVYGVPETFVIDKTGVIRMKHIGPMTEEVWSRDVVPLIKKLQG